MKNTPSLLVLLAFCTISAHAKADHLNGLTVGVLAGTTSNAYAVNDKASISPLILYDNDYVYAEGLDVGFYAYKDDKNWFRVGANYDARRFKPDDAIIDELKGLDERKPSVNMTISYMRITPVGGFELKAGVDTTGNSEGRFASLAHRSRFKFADDRLVVYPKVGVNWYSEDYNQYYFGVSQAQSDTANQKTGVNIDTYTAKSSYSPFVSVSGKYQFTDHLGAFASTKAEWLSSTQKNSPLTDDDVNIAVHAGLTYTF